MALITCPDCAGMGNQATRITRRKSGALKSVTFNLKENCATCSGTGKALVKRNVLYVGRPDLNNEAA
jgi:DnaJ-class molecular chaperone